MQYVCKYAPIEIAAGFDMDAEFLNPTAENYESADRIIHSNICSFSRAIVEKRLNNDNVPLLLTTCCDSIERACDVLKNQEQEVYMLNLPHNSEHCSKLLYKNQILKLIDDLSRSLGRTFDIKKFCSVFNDNEEEIEGPYISVMGARLSSGLLEYIRRESPLPVKNNSCTGLRKLPKPLSGGDPDELITWYSGALLSQTPCMRMTEIKQRRDLTEDPNLCGIIYNTVNFCDFYSLEFSKLKAVLKIPILKIETDYTNQGGGQMKTRLEAFFENALSGIKKEADHADILSGDNSYYAGIDSGSTSTNAVIIDNKKNIVSFAVIPTGTKVGESAEKAFDEALKKSDLEKEQIKNIVATGYGRSKIHFRGKDVTEITCHAKGAYFLDPTVRTIIDVGGQDSKIIRLDHDGNVLDFVMNDKCAAGTGRFIEMMAQSLQLSLEEMSTYGAKWTEEVVISNMCSVFAQSEVVSLIAEDKKLEDIVHGINKSVASKVVAIGKRGKMEGAYMMTGGVARNVGVLRAIEEKLGEKVIVPKEPDICGALGAALLATEILKV